MMVWIGQLRLLERRNELFLYINIFIFFIFQLIVFYLDLQVNYQFMVYLAICLLIRVLAILIKLISQFPFFILILMFPLFSLILIISAFLFYGTQSTIVVLIIFIRLPFSFTFLFLLFLVIFFIYQFYWIYSSFLYHSLFNYFNYFIKHYYFIRLIIDY